jgi:hypothetical protein
VPAVALSALAQTMCTPAGSSRAICAGQGPIFTLCAGLNRNDTPSAHTATGGQPFGTCAVRSRSAPTPCKTVARAGDAVLTRARLNDDGRVFEVLRDGPERRLGPEIDRATIDATTEEEIASQPGMRSTLCATPGHLGRLASGARSGCRSSRSHAHQRARRYGGPKPRGGRRRALVRRRAVRHRAWRAAGRADARAPGRPRRRR